MKDGMDLAEHCVEYGLEKGCSYVEARYVEQVIRGLAYRNGQPVSGGMTPSSGVGVRVLVDGNMGFASFDRLEKGLAERAMTTAMKMASNGKRDVPIDLGEPVTNKATWKTKAKEPLEDVSIEDMMETASQLNKQ
ncbi:hypothetical protein EU545_05005, partial [Candidatus Thorarchaeota archaeon]